MMTMMDPQQLAMTPADGGQGYAPVVAVLLPAEKKLRWSIMRRPNRSR